MKTLKPIKSQVLILDVPPEKDEKVGGILMPFPRQKNQATVIGVGPNVIDLKVGERVIYTNPVADVELDGVTHRIVPAEDILCVLE